MKARILLLRPEPGASKSAEKARALGLHPVVAPIFTVRPLEWDAPDPKGFDALILTSANVMLHAGPKLTLYTALPVHAVGEATARAAEAAGFHNIRAGSAGIEMLLRGIRGDAKLLHLCGREHIEPERKGIYHLPVYAVDAAERLPDAAVQALKDGALALLHSPRAAALFAKLVDEAGFSRDTIRIAALSPAVAHSAGEGWGSKDAAITPHDETLLALAARRSGVKD